MGSLFADIHANWREYDCSFNNNMVVCPAIHPVLAEMHLSHACKCHAIRDKPETLTARRTTECETTKQSHAKATPNAPRFLSITLLSIMWSSSSHTWVKTIDRANPPTLELGGSLFVFGNAVGSRYSTLTAHKRRSRFSSCLRV